MPKTQTKHNWNNNYMQVYIVDESFKIQNNQILHVSILLLYLLYSILIECNLDVHINKHVSTVCDPIGRCHNIR